MYQCAKCSETVSSEITLLGGHICYLCVRHRNEWHEFSESKGYRRYIEMAETKLLAAIVANDSIQMRKWLGQKQNALARANSLSKAWLADPSTNDSQRQDAE